MDILSNLTNLLGGAGGQQQSSSSGGLGGLGALAGLLGGGGAQSSSSAGADPLGGLGGIVGALLGGGSSSRSAASGLAGLMGGGSGGSGGGLGALGGLVSSLMGGSGGGLLSSLLGGEKEPPAPQANTANPSQAQAVNTLRALVYAARADGKMDANERQSISTEAQKAGLSREGQELVNQFMSEDVDPNNIARNITSGQEALQIYALSCAITRVDTFMEKQYLESLAQALRIPPQTKAAIEQKITG